MAASNPCPPAIYLIGVSKSYGAQRSFQALNNVDLAVPEGQFLAVLGKSGSGKSTMLNLIGGLDQPTAGVVQVAGETVSGRSESALAEWRGTKIGFVFQFFQLLPTLSVQENVAAPMEFAGRHTPAERRTRVMSLLDQLGLSDHAQKLPSQLSGGQQQRAAIARALANDPPVILADEPTGNLDTSTAAAVIEILGGLAKQGRTVLMITHDAEAAAKAARLIRLSDGQIVEDRMVPEAA
jgi:putative ABC transport system ATP-binding protein